MPSSAQYWVHTILLSSVLGSRAPHLLSVGFTPSSAQRALTNLSFLFTDYLPPETQPLRSSGWREQVLLSQDQKASANHKDTIKVPVEAKCKNKMEKEVASSQLTRL